MRNLRLVLAATDAEHRFAQDLTKQNMELLTRSHWGEWRADVLSAHYPSWVNFLIFDGDKPIGYVGVERKGDVIALHNLQIKDKYRVHGIGQWALREIESQSEFEHCKFIEGYVFKDNRAVSFFPREGFGVVERDEHCFTIRKRK